MVNQIKQNYILLLNNMRIPKVKYCIVLLISTTILLFPPKSSKAQNTGSAIVMSSVGSIQNISNNSMALSFNSNIACLNIQNGTIVLTGEKGTGDFDLNCKSKAKFNSLGIQLSPNPVNAIAHLKSSNTPPLNETFLITIWGMDGFKIMTEKMTSSEFILGKKIDFSKLTAGTFIIQVESSNFVDALKFIKSK